MFLDRPSNLQPHSFFHGWSALTIYTFFKSCHGTCPLIFGTKITVQMPTWCECEAEAICNAGGALERPVWRVSAAEVAEVDGARGAVLAPTAALTLQGLGEEDGKYNTLTRAWTYISRLFRNVCRRRHCA